MFDPRSNIDKPRPDVCSTPKETAVSGIRYRPNATGTSFPTGPHVDACHVLAALIRDAIRCRATGAGMGQTDLLLGIRLERRTKDLIRMYRIGDINRNPCLPRLHGALTSASLSPRNTAGFRHDFRSTDREPL